MYYAQSLYNATLYEEAMKVTVTVEAPEYQGSMQKLQAAIRYELNHPILLRTKCDDDLQVRRGGPSRSQVPGGPMSC